MKRLVLSFILYAYALFSPSDLVAQKLVDSSDGYKMSVTLDNENAIYKQGQTVNATVRLTYDGTPFDGTVKWIKTKDYYTPSKEQGELSLKNGEATLSCSLDEPGFIHLRFNFITPEKNTISQMVGAGIDPYKIGRSMPPPEDFDEYWELQKQLQAKVPANIRLTEVDSKMKGITAYDVQADCVPGNFSAYLAFPEGADPKSLPAMVLCHGAGVASSRLSIAAKWASEGIVVIDFNVHGLPNGQPQEFYKALYPKGKLEKYYMYDTSDRDSLFFRAMIFRLMRAFDIVTGREEWDGENLIAFGRSQGGAQALIAGGLDPRVDLVCAEIPALCDLTGFAVNRISGWPKLVTVDKDGNPDPVATKSARYVDAMNFAPKIKGKCYLTVGFIDLSCPATGVFAVYNEIKAEKHILHHTTTGHRVTPEGEAYVRQAVLDYLDGIKAAHK